MFQSSSYWRLAGITRMYSPENLKARFNPHHTGDWLEFMKDKLIDWIFTHPGFNPHHTGDWLEWTTTAKVGKPMYWFQSSSYWRLAGIPIWTKGRKDYTNCFNPHHTGDWLESMYSFQIIAANGSFQSSSYWRLAGIQIQYRDEQPLTVSILIILATGWNRDLNYRCLTTLSGFNPHHTGDWLEFGTYGLENAFSDGFNPHHTGDWLE